MSTLQELLHAFAPITLGEMDRVVLQDRMDTKFAMGAHELPGVLEDMRAHYRCLEVDGVRGTDYRSLYLDDLDRRHFLDHHNGRTFRAKVRYREYVGSGLCFLEVKRKTGRGRTDKARLPVAGIPATPPAEHLAFIADAGGLLPGMRPVLWNRFTRYTFVHHTLPERLTIDVDMHFEEAGTARGLDGIVVAEVKQERIDRRSPIMRIMRQRGHRPSGMSKYCIGSLLLHADLKYNRFKATLLQLGRLRAAA